MTRSPGGKGKTKNGARERSLRALVRVAEEGWFAGEALEREIQGVADERERSLATEITFGTLRHEKSLDYLLGQVSKRPLPELDPWTRSILRQAVYQLEHLDRIPSRAVVHEAVELSRRHGHEGTARFVNGVLRNFLRRRQALAWPDRAADPATYLAVRYSHPDWLIDRWLARYGTEATEELLRYNNRTPALSIRANRLKISPEELARALHEAGIEVERGRFLPEALRVSGVGSLEENELFQAGFFQVQDESSMLVAPVLDPQPGERILDVAAAPGGKATHLAERMQDRGEVLANDPQEARVRRIAANVARLGLKSVRPTQHDGLDLSWLEEPVDRILLDAPCSGTGVLNRRPDARWKKTPESLEEVLPLQEALLAEAARWVKVGGVLVYSTCSLEPEENQEQVRRFLAAWPGYAVEPAGPLLPEALGPALAREGWLQTLPQVHELDGFFICRLRRRR